MRTSYTLQPLFAHLRRNLSQLIPLRFNGIDERPRIGAQHAKRISIWRNMRRHPEPLRATIQRFFAQSLRDHPTPLRTPRHRECGRVDFETDLGKATLVVNTSKTPITVSLSRDLCNVSTKQQGRAFIVNPQILLGIK